MSTQEGLPHPTATIGCQFNPIDPTFAQKPRDFYELARREAPVCYVPHFDMWLVSRYDDIVTVLRDPHRFSSSKAAEPPEALPPEVLTILQEGYPPAGAIVGTDPPMHQRIRALVSGAFSPRRIAAMEPSVRAIADELIDCFSAQGSADLVEQFAYPLPMTVIIDMLGIPRSHMGQVKSWHDALFGSMFVVGVPTEQRVEFAREGVTYQHYLGDIVADRRISPRDDFITALVEARAFDAEPLSTGEIVWILIFLVTAGHETTTNLIANMMMLLLEDPAQWKAVVGNPSLFTAAVEETLRVEAPFLLMRRTTTEQVELGGVVIPKGAAVGLLNGSGGIDENVFNSGARFDIRHPHPKPHLGFGSGIHYCVGALLARQEGRIALQSLSERLPNLRLAPAFEAVYEPNVFLRALKRLPIVWDVGD